VAKYEEWKAAHPQRLSAQRGLAVRFWQGSVALDPLLCLPLLPGLSSAPLRASAA